jgi:hypothetical protein
MELVRAKYVIAFHELRSEDAFCNRLTELTIHRHLNLNKFLPFCEIRIA